VPYGAACISSPLPPFGRAFFFSGIIHRRPLFLRQRDALRFSRNSLKPVCFPVRLSLLDTLARAGDEVPPDKARSIHRFAAEQHQPHWRLARAEDDGITCLEYHQPAGVEAAAAVDLQGAV